MCCSLKQEALTSTLLHAAVAGIACSAGGHRGEARHQSSHASKAALPQPEALLLTGRRTFLSNLHMLPNDKGSQGGGCQARGSCSWGFLSSAGGLPFFIAH